MDETHLQTAFGFKRVACFATGCRRHPPSGVAVQAIGKVGVQLLCVVIQGPWIREHFTGSGCSWGRSMQHSATEYTRKKNQRKPKLVIASRCLAPLDSRAMAGSGASTLVPHGTPLLGLRLCRSEPVCHRHDASREDTTQDIFEYIDVFFNCQRRHSTLGYNSPVDRSKDSSGLIWCPRN